MEFIYIRNRPMFLLSLAISTGILFLTYIVLILRDTLFEEKEELPFTVSDSVAVDVIHEAYQLRLPIHKRRAVANNL
jgi:hypothetical protein